MRRAAFAILGVLLASPAFAEPCIGISGEPVCSTAPSTSEVLTFDGTEWCAAAAAGGSSNAISQLDSDVTVTDAGAGDASINIDGVLVAMFVDSGGADVNYLTFTSAITTAGPIIAPAGSDTNIDLNLAAKAGGVVGIDGVLEIHGNQAGEVTLNSTATFLTLEVGGADIFSGNGSSSFVYDTLGGGGLYWSLAYQDATATSPNILPEVSDPDTGLCWPGADQLGLCAGGVESMRFNTVGSGVNYLDVTPAAAGSGPTLTCDGSDANCKLNFAGKGTAGVSTQGCEFFGSSSAAPTGAECDSYWDTDLNMICYYNGTNWLQADDWSTVCS